MSDIETKATAHLSIAENQELHKAMLASLQAVNNYFDSPSAAKPNLAQDIKTANNIINSFAKIRQSESGDDMVKLQIARAICTTREEFKTYIAENLTHIETTKKLPAMKD